MDNNNPPVYKKCKLSSLDFLSLKKNNDLSCYPVCMPDDSFSFLHEAACIEFKGKLFAAWYQNEEKELIGATPIFWTYSMDEGKTFVDKKLLVIDNTKQILYCPPVFGICDGHLYMLINEMYIEPDHIHALDLYIYDEENDTFEFLWSRPIPFKLNTNVYTLDNGKLMLPGRLAELDGFPVTPAVLISDSGKIDADWRVVKVQEDGGLPDGKDYIHPEQSAIVQGNHIVMFCRTDREPKPILYISEDYGETWSKPILYDVPVSSSKIYSGTLSSGQHYWIGNLFPHERKKLAFLYTSGKDLFFDKGFLLQDGPDEKLEGSGKQWSYPAAYEANDKLFVIYTAAVKESHTIRGAVLSVIPLKDLK